jgi:hypothetical protein
MTRHNMFWLLVVLAVTMLVLPRGLCAATGEKQTLQDLPVTGQLAHGGRFTGRLTIAAFTVDDLGQLAATGTLAGTVVHQTGTTTLPRLPFTARAPLLDLRGTCTTLVLDLEPLFLAPLGQAVTLTPVVLDAKAGSTTEHLLRTTLCTLARLQG